MVQSDGHTPSLQDKAPVTFIGQTLQTIDLEENFGVRLVASNAPRQNAT